MVIVGAWGFFLNLELVYALWGATVAVIAAVLLPFLLLIGPIYFAWAYDHWLPLLVVYAGLAFCQGLRSFGDTLMRPRRM